MSLFKLDKINIPILIIFIMLFRINYAMAEEKSVKRIISLVYDDSGSMFQDKSLKWSRANYAVQVFCGLLGEDDELYITYMSDYNNTKKFDITRGNKRQDTINKIRSDIYMTQVTPFESVLEATKKLKNVKINTNTNIENWIIIMTDGMFFEDDDGTKINYEIKNLMKVKKQEGKQFRLIYLGIGEKALEVNGDKTEGIYTKMARGEDIFKGLQDAAGVISGKTVVYPESIKVIKNKIELKTSFPLKNLVIFSQRENNKIIECKQKDNYLNFDERYNLEYSKVSAKAPPDTNLVGNITYITSSQDGVIPAGIINIKYSNNINKENITLLYEPSIELDFQLIKDGLVVQEDKIKIGDTINIKAILKDPNTGEIIANDLLPKIPEYILNVFQGNEKLSSKTKENKVKLTNTHLKISGMCDLDNFFNLRKEREYKVKEFKKFSINGQEWDADLKNLDKQSEGIFKLLNEKGSEVLKEDFEKIEFSVITDKQVLFEVKKNDDMTLSIKANYWYKRFVTSAGEIPITIKGEYSDGEIKELKTKIHIKDISLFTRYKEFFLWLIYMLILLWYIVGIIKKPRFDKKRTYIEYSRIQYIAGMKQKGNPMTLTFITSVFSRWFVPYISEKCDLNGLTLEAGKKRAYVVIPIFAQHDKMKVDGFYIGEEENKKPYSVNSETEIEISRGSVVEIYKYKT